MYEEGKFNITRQNKYIRPLIPTASDNSGMKVHPYLG